MQSVAGSASDNAVRTAAWRVIPLLAVGYIVSYIDRVNVGFADGFRSTCEPASSPGSTSPIRCRPSLAALCPQRYSK